MRAATPAPRGDAATCCRCSIGPYRLDLQFQTGQPAPWPRTPDRARGKGFDRPCARPNDDLANAVAGVAQLCAVKGLYDTSYRWVDGRLDDDPDGTEAWRRTRLQGYVLSGGWVRL